MEELERAYVVPLKDAYEKPRIKRAKVAAKMLRAFVSKHMKVDGDSVKISGPANSAIWESGMKKPPRKLRIIANRDKEGIVRVTLATEKEDAAKDLERAKRKEERKKAKPAQKPAEKPAVKETPKAQAEPPKEAPKGNPQEPAKSEKKK